jgi:hypothetical protein
VELLHQFIIMTETSLFFLWTTEHGSYTTWIWPMHCKFESSGRLVVSQGGKELDEGNHNTGPPSDKHGRRRSGFYVFL